GGSAGGSSDRVKASLTRRWEDDRTSPKNPSSGESRTWFGLDRTTLHFNIRAVCDEGRDRLCSERLEEFFAVECGDVSFQFEGIRRPDFPPWMFDAVLTRAFAPCGVAPVMFGNEFFVGTGRVRLRFAVRGHGEMFPFIAAAPLV